jgi:serine/threonine protein kinase
MHHFRAFTNSVTTAAKELSKEFSGSSADISSSGRQYVINGKTIVEDKLLSEGGFGYVYLAHDAKTNEEYVLKKILCMDKERLNLANREVEIFEKLPVHPNLVRYHGHVTLKESRNREVVILMEYCPNGHLYDMMKANPAGIPTKPILKILLDISKGLEALHRMNPPVQHRDLKLENILVAKSKSYVIVDFGSWSSDEPNLSDLDRTELMNFNEVVERYTTLMYRPPEMADLYKGFKISTKVDIWMLGCILFTLINNKHPFQDASNLAIVNCRYLHDVDMCKKHPPKLIDLCNWLLAQSPGDRPTSSDLVEILSNWDSQQSLPLQLPPAVVERIEKDHRLYGIPTAKSRRQSRRSSTSSKVTKNSLMDNNVWASTAPTVAPTWQADFGNLIDIESAQVPPPPSVHANKNESYIPDLLG